MNKKTIKRVCSVVLVFAVVFTVCSFGFSANADAKLDELNRETQKITDEINKLKKEKADQTVIKNALDKQIASLQREIDAYNKVISECKAAIAQSEATIAEKNKEIEQTKEDFKKRIRSIYMSNTNSNVQILLGAESFADFLALSELTQCISAQDKAMVDKIVATIGEINDEIEANKQRQSEQDAAKAYVVEKQNLLNAQVDEVNAVISTINKSTNSANSDLKKLEKEKNEYLQSLLGGEVSSEPFDGVFRWPTPGYTYISAGWQSNDSVHNGHHYGIDIAGGSIRGSAIRASATGKVVESNNSCTHDYKKYSSCGCGHGFGNFVKISHGIYNGKYYNTLYGHMKNTAVSTGAYVASGQVIGYVGCTGWSTGNHLHFAVMQGTSPNNMYYVNPFNFSYVGK